MSKFISYQQYIETSFNKKLTKSVSLSLTASSWSGGAYHHVLHHILHHHGGACDDVLHNLQGYYSGGAQHDDYELYTVTGLTRSLSMISKKMTYRRDPVAIPCITVTPTVVASSSLVEDCSIPIPAPAPTRVVREKVEI